MHSTSTTSIFNNPKLFVEGWYWALPSKKLKIGKVKAVKLLGRNLAIYRGASGQVIAVDAYCPHMGAHLAEGKVEGEGIRCFFHNWKYDERGICVEVPSLGKPLPVCIKTWSTAEKYGMIWVWVGEDKPSKLPFVPELENVEFDYILGTRFVKNCHPNVLLINAIDAHHFNTVHNLPLEIVFDSQNLNSNAITFSNITRGGDDSWLIRLIRPLYRNEVTYSMCYWYGNTGTVTLGPDFLHFYIIFALRMLEDGKTEGQTILVTRKRNGFLGWSVNRVLLWLTQQVGNYFAKGDTQVFQTIQFDLKIPIKADQSILQFIQHVNQQKALTWKTWETVDSPISSASLFEHEQH
ncbi:Rieske [2Fe-2S] domain-containing protein [Tolypothrix tenuis PCC 7101]|uniref:Rieske [2Fe-2S] domain-containing protein n=1 Tax=Tolypothrix tenuis PCC 7101 TaxID=231146 RepID=A0A1Z4MZW3_9CYAN|nr:aromatic ring-hydroxylating dioxygenase subunit alpha [Aulosira sp. FACHB-113]BAY98983.1 Rieske [2Fe-2S] domain-containing protein [Tolypothrix tenuis PCC 7101]BAZ77097.1 Rieske [2Fe-2S] domain-containing protein [Aulosira laxa NIES-50]